jgi:hypothetical protein
MKLLLTISAFVAAVIGVALIFATPQFLASSGIEATAAIGLFAKLQGVCLLSIALINWLSRQAKEWAALRAVIAGNLLLHAGSIPVNVYALRSRIVGSQAWGEIVVHLVFGIAFAYFLFRNKVVVSPA